MDGRSASKTAVLACQGRAVADGRLAADRFHDPVAAQLLRPDEREPVEQARSGSKPAGWRDRLDVERVAACAEVMVPRTVAIDEAARERSNPQVVIVGAGLDGRPWRWDPHLAPVLFAVDHPATQSDVADRATDLQPTVGRFVPVPADLATEPLDARLAGAGHHASIPTTWIWEGVVPYLTATQVRSTVAAMSVRSAPGSALLVNYQSPHLRARFGRALAGAISRVTGTADPLADEPWRSMWTSRSMAELLGEHGWRVDRDDDLGAIADRLDLAIAHRNSVASGRVAVAVIG